jgi:transcriptional regulator with XRE-family HTH domain
MTLEDVQTRTEERFGDDRILEATLSRIERGTISKPPSLLDAAELGLLYNLSPSKLFQLYGLPVSGDGDAPEPNAVTRLRLCLNELRDDPEATKELLSWVDFACTKVVASRKR